MNSAARPRRRLILVNTVSDAVIDGPPEDYVSMVEASPARQAWMLWPGELLLTAGQVPGHMASYIAGVLGTSGSVCLRPADSGSPYLVDRVLTDGRLLSYLGNLDLGMMELWPFVLDTRAVALAKRLGIGLAGYGSRAREYAEVNQVATSVVAPLNTKSGFREVARTLGLPVARGTVITCIADLRPAAHELASDYGAVIIKRDRASNGYAHRVVRAGAPDEENGPVADVPYVIEEFVDSDWAPSIEIEICDDGPRVLYPCDQRRTRNSWTGMVIPPDEIPAELLSEMTAGALRFGEYLRAAGYRGICDVDGLASRSGSWVVTETNLRVTGGTHVHAMLERLVGADYLTRGHAVADSVPVKGRSFAEFTGQLRDAGLLFDAATSDGVLITADGSLTDGKYRYVVYGQTLRRTLKIERQLQELPDKRAA